MSDALRQFEANNNDPQLQFSEANSPWQGVPAWAMFLIRCGYLWGNTVLGNRRISLISMPCESAAAGLVVLGAMCRRLTIDGANDSSSHYQRLERLARSENVRVFLRHNYHRGLFELEYRGGLLWGRNGGADDSRLSNRRRTGYGILPHQACDWYIEGEGPVQAALGAELPHRSFYEGIIGIPSPIRSNFSHSDSGICLAGRVAGGSVSRSVFEKIRFRNHDCDVDLARLLAIQNWSPRSISRTTLFNSRTGHHDRNPGLTRLVVADGDGAFLKVIQTAEFASSDVVGVIHRAIGRDELEAIGVKITELTQWYTPDIEAQNELPATPTGITVTTLRKR